MTSKHFDARLSQQLLLVPFPLNRLDNSGREHRSLIVSRHFPVLGEIAKVFSLAGAYEWRSRVFTPNSLPQRDTKNSTTPSGASRIPTPLMQTRTVSRLRQVPQSLRRSAGTLAFTGVSANDRRITGHPSPKHVF